MTTPEQKEYIRDAVMRNLYRAQLTGLILEGLHINIQRALPDTTARDVQEALNVLSGFGNIAEKNLKPYGVTATYHLTSQGILFCERNALT